MKRRAFIKGSAIIGAAITSPLLLKGRSGMISSTASRKVASVLKASRTMVGTLPILRAFAGDHQDLVSPYVMFDEFGPVTVQAGSDPLRVDAHPHAGIIPTTYFLDGSGHHKDSLNYDFQVTKGEFMMFSSGRGAIHMEETGRQLFDQGGTYHGFQIWLNMPAPHKFNAPATHVYRGSEIGVLEHSDYSAHVVLGELFGVRAAADLLSPAFYYHIRLKEGRRLDIPTDPMHNAFIYLIKGDLELEGRRALKANQVALFHRGESMVELFSQEGAELLVLGGQPLNERVVSYGPFVMNSEEQIRQCIRDYQTGKMGDPDKVNR